MLDIELERIISVIITFKYVTGDHRSIGNILQWSAYTDGNYDVLYNELDYICCKEYLIGLSMIIMNGVFDDPYNYLSKHMIHYMQQFSEENI